MQEAPELRVAGELHLVDAVQEPQHRDRVLGARDRGEVGVGLDLVRGAVLEQVGDAVDVLAAQLRQRHEDAQRAVAGLVDAQLLRERRLARARCAFDQHDVEELLLLLLHFSELTFDALRQVFAVDRCAGEVVDDVRAFVVCCLRLMFFCVRVYSPAV